MIKLINFCTNIRNLRRNLNFTQHELAGKLGISQNYLSSIEQGKKRPPIEIVLALSEIFDTKLDDLFGDAPQSSQALPTDIEKLIEKKIQQALQAQASRGEA